MTFILVSSIFISLSLTLPLLLAPLTLGFWILLISLLSARLITLFSSSWFGLILFIIYIGGILVIFSYFTAVAPNQKLNITILIFITSIMILLIYTFQTPYKFLTPSQQPLCLHTNIQSFAYLYTPNQTPFLIILALLLLLALIFVVKITNRNYGPLRPFS